jgi:Mn-dependent DtxR family transcriptional regulator
MRYTQALMRHIAQLTACNNRHSIEQRLSRWLLITQDRVQANQFQITQEFLSQMLGAHRQSITLAASHLQSAGLIRYSRGKLSTLDRRGLEAASCECYQAVAREFEDLFA